MCIQKYKSPVCKCLLRKYLHKCISVQVLVQVCRYASAQVGETGAGGAWAHIEHIEFEYVIICAFLYHMQVVMNI